MQKIFFVIRGNQDDPHGNPLPYHRTTQRMSYLPASLKYEAWKSHVQVEFFRAYNFMGTPVVLTDLPVAKRQTIFLARGGDKPIIVRDKKMRTDIKIFWASKHHGDPDNVLKGINDALYQNDKLVAGSVDFEYDPDKKGRVEVTITIC